MDSQYFPDILALSLLLVGFRPLVRRVGAYVDLWFLGWAFVLLRLLILAFPPTAGAARMFGAMTSAWLLVMCGLSFVLAASRMALEAGKRYAAKNGRARELRLCRMTPGFVVCLGLPVLLQAGLGLVPGVPSWPERAACGLFLLPGVWLLGVRMRERRQGRPGRTLVLIALAYALFGIAMLPLAVHEAAIVRSGVLALLFITAAHLYMLAVERWTRGALAAAVGLVLWGVFYPATAVYLRLHPLAVPSRLLEDLPQYMVVAGMLLTLLEEHVKRTERMAMHDPLTDLPNRRLFEERLVTTMEEARQTRTTVACLVIDVDNFKTINDTLGHTAGDQLLRALAVRLSWHMSPRDILARTGGDEFTALLAGVSDEHHLRFIAGAMMSAASVPVAIDGMSVDVRISIGIALSPDHADDIDSLRRAADEAMYSAKRRGGSLLAFAGE